MGKEAVQPRAVAVSIPYSIESDGTKVVCLVSSRKNNSRFVLPKGGVEKGETGRQAAIREMWEEAGLVPSKGEETKSNSKQRTIFDHKPHKSSSITDPESEGFVPRAVYEAHEILVVKGDADSELSEWPEKEERTRKWVTFQQAVELISWRRDIHDLLLGSSLAPKV